METQKNWLKFMIGWLLCLVIRLLPFRPPNVEPVLGTLMPFSAAFNPLAGFLFGFLNIVFFDILTLKIGIWTIITAWAYGGIGIVATMFFRKIKPNAISYGVFAIIGTILYDAVTGLTIGPIFLHQSFAIALAGQIPFTLWHLAGDVTAAVFLSPLIHTWVVKNKRFETKGFFKLNPIP